jgi:hypothetical protein
MKKKIFFAVATGFFAVATVFNMNLLQGNSAGDVSLDAIAVMAQAQSEVTIGLICFITYDLCGLEYEFGQLYIRIGRRY